MELLCTDFDEADLCASIYRRQEPNKRIALCHPDTSVIIVWIRFFFLPPPWSRFNVFSIHIRNGCRGTDGYIVYQSTTVWMCTFFRLVNIMQTNSRVETHQFPFNGVQSSYFHMVRYIPKSIIPYSFSIGSILPKTKNAHPTCRLFVSTAVFYPWLWVQSVIFHIHIDGYLKNPSAGFHNRLQKQAIDWSTVGFLISPKNGQPNEQHRFDLTTFRHTNICI